MQVRQKVRKSRFIIFFQWFVAQERRKVGSLKRRVRSQLARWEMKNEMSKKCTLLWPKAHFEVKMQKAHYYRSTFGSWDVEKVQAVVARRHISKSKCTKHARFGPLLEVEMSKKCAPLWREAHFQVKMYIAHQVRTTFGSWDVEKVPAVVARSKFRSQKCKKLTVSDHFWKLRCRKSARRCSAKHISKSKCTKHTIIGPLLDVDMSKKCAPLWREAHFEVKSVKNWGVRSTCWRSDVVLCGRCKGLWTLPKVSKTWMFCGSFKYNYNYATLHLTTLHYNYTTTTTTTTVQLHYTTLHYTTLHYTTLH